MFTGILLRLVGLRTDKGDRLLLPLVLGIAGYRYWGVNSLFGICLTVVNTGDHWLK